MKRLVEEDPMWDALSILRLDTGENGAMDRDHLVKIRSHELLGGHAMSVRDDRHADRGPTPTGHAHVSSRILTPCRW